LQWTYNPPNRPPVPVNEIVLTRILEHYNVSSFPHDFVAELSLKLHAQHSSHRLYEVPSNCGLSEPPYPPRPTNNPLGYSPPLRIPSLCRP
jgi:hypothetical protein